MEFKIAEEAKAHSRATQQHYDKLEELGVWDDVDALMLLSADPHEIDEPDLHPWQEADAFFQLIGSVVELDQPPQEFSNRQEVHDDFLKLSCFVEEFDQPQQFPNRQEVDDLVQLRVSAAQPDQPQQFPNRQDVNVSFQLDGGAAAENDEQDFPNWYSIGLHDLLQAQLSVAAEIHKLDFPNGQELDVLVHVKGAPTNFDNQQFPNGQDMDVFQLGDAVTENDDQYFPYWQDLYDFLQLGGAAAKNEEPYFLNWQALDDWLQSQLGGAVAGIDKFDFPNLQDLEIPWLDESVHVGGGAVAMDEQNFSKSQSSGEECEAKVLLVHNLTMSFTEDMLRSEFSVYGPIKRCKRHPGYATIHFEESEDALRAMNALNGHIVLGVILEVSMLKGLQTQSPTEG